ncbi:MAG: glycosyl hydrolase [Paenibacillaceae bacterium]|jgi:unsaturated chondroitin disaccharide hydrolase|nr:glycosyl hydrolase [Paenibacillaceae bacterium]
MEQRYYQELLERLQPKVDRMIEGIGDKSPHVAREDGIYDNLGTDWWTSGFWPGILWVMYEATGKENYKEAAWEWDRKLAPWLSKPTGEIHHDVGFQFLPTAVIKHRLTGDQDALVTGLTAANFLAGRFNPAGNFIRAWNGDRTGWAIIDCMMNLSILFWASQTSGDPRFKHIATRHADTALQHFLRPDGSVNHIVSFDAETGAYIESLGGQGFGPQSGWSRGTGWAVYGFANAYKYTGDARYLDAAKRTAYFFLSQLPEDHVPHWDFRVDNRDGEPRDSSAGALVASGLLEIVKHVPAAEAAYFQEKAEKIVVSLTDNYGTWDNEQHQAILLHGTGHKPAKSNVDVSLIYGDYFYVEAVAKLAGWQGNVF